MDASTLKRAARRVATGRPMLRLRSLTARALVPELPALRTELDELRGVTEELRERVASLESERQGLVDRVAVLDGDLDESRRLTGRVAELTDLVTEVVLPLHDRDIDAERLRPHDIEPH